MKWKMPAKTFLLGEYAALAGAPAMLLTTNPCFEVSLVEQPGLDHIHPLSPAGRWWGEHGNSHWGLQWVDPYQGRGGMGASSAQFLGAYLASQHLQHRMPTQADMLAAYIQSAKSLEGLPPSGYDVQAQSLYGLVWIDQQNKQRQIFDWPFKTIDFVLLHTGQKLATHEHLQGMVLPRSIDSLAALVQQAKVAVVESDADLMVASVNAYHGALAHMNLVADHSLQHIAVLKEHPDILAMKGCGAMGADVLLLIVPAAACSTIRVDLAQKGWRILASSSDLYRENALINK
jgi:mevalonate kinase